MRKHYQTTPLAVTVEAWAFVGVLVATIWLYQAGLIAELIVWSASLGTLFGGLIAGAAYSTFVTTPFSIAALLEIGSTLTMPIWQVALIGAIGATVMDFLLVEGLRSPLAALLVRAIVGRDIESFKRRIGRSTKLRWFAGLFGGFLMGFPLPTDELGVVFFAASGLRPLQMIPLIFIADFIGIYVILTTAQLVAGT